MLDAQIASDVKSNPLAIWKSQRFQSLRFHLRFLPCPSFPCFFGIPGFFLLQGFPCFLSVFPFFSRDFRGSVGITNPCFFAGFPCRFPKKTRKGRTGFSLSDRLRSNFDCDFVGALRFKSLRSEISAIPIRDLRNLGPKGWTGQESADTDHSRRTQ